MDTKLYRKTKLGKTQYLHIWTDGNEIKRGIETLEKACGFYVERRMNQSIQTAMSGHNVNEFE